MRALRYLPAYLIPLSVLLGVQWGGAWTWFTPVVVFIAIPLVELLVGRDPFNLDPEAEAMARRQPLFSWILWSHLPIQLGLTLFVLWRLSHGEFTLLETMGVLISLGTSNGGVGITVAHELVHRARASSSGWVACC